MTPKQCMLLGLMIIAILLRLRKKRKRTRDILLTSSLTGKAYIQELMHGSPTQMYELFRMNTDVFVRLCDHFRGRGWLDDSRFVSVEEKMAIFLNIIAQSHGNRVVKYRFQHSGQTISKYFHEVLWAMLHFSREQIVDPPFNGPIGEIRQHRQLRQGPFKGAVGALDGTLISACVPVNKQIPFLGRGGKKCYQNVMAACDFDMKFVYVMAGWEGITHDARVLNETLKDQETNQFPIPPEGKYYLCDAAYTHTRGFMCPYRNARYWAKDFKKGGPPRSKEELFNQKHAELRNVIERTYGVFKARFKILNQMPSYSYRTQVHIIVACMAVHNYLRQVSLNDQLFHQYEDENVQLPQTPSIDDENIETPPTYDQIFGNASTEYMINLRAQIAQQLVNGNYD